MILEIYKPDKFDYLILVDESKLQLNPQLIY